MQSWRNALAQLRQNPLARRIDTYSPRSETERALVESIKQLEVQCKERIDLLEALRVSRESGGTLPAAHSEDLSGLQSSWNGGSAATSSTAERGWLGDGTIPALSYTDLSKPPPLPHRPTLPDRASSENTIINGDYSAFREKATSQTVSRPSLPPYSPSSNTINSMTSGGERSESPEKHTMRTTLRSKRSDKGSSTPSKSRSSNTNKRPGASMAATLAWSGRDTKESSNRSTTKDQSELKIGTPDRQRRSEETARPTAGSRHNWDSHTRRLVAARESATSASASASRSSPEPIRGSSEFAHKHSSTLALGAASSALNSLNLQDRSDHPSKREERDLLSRRGAAVAHERPSATKSGTQLSASDLDANRDRVRRKPLAKISGSQPNSAKRNPRRSSSQEWKHMIESTDDEMANISDSQQRLKGPHQNGQDSTDDAGASAPTSEDEQVQKAKREWQKRKKSVLRNLPPGVDEAAAQAIFNEIVVQGDEVHWSDVAGLEIAKTALREAVVYPFLRPDLFMGLREPARGMLLFGPPGTGKTMLARAVATESKSTFFSISASSLTSKYLGESEKLVRALFGLARVMAPSIIFVDEIDSLLSQRSGSGEHEATRRIKTEFLIQWSDLQRAAAGKEAPVGLKDRGDPNRVLVLAATNLPWAIDEAARRRFVRRQYIPLPEAETRSVQLNTLLGQQKHSLSNDDIADLVMLTDGTLSFLIHKANH